MSFRQKDFRKIRRMESSNAILQIVLLALVFTGVNYLALPAGNAPMGLVEGAPSGVQIIGRRWREDQILDALEVVEASVGLPSHELWAREKGE